MVRFLCLILAFFGLSKGIHATDTSDRSAQEAVLAFADEFLDSEAKARLRDLSTAGYSTFLELDVSDTALLSDSDWGNILIEELQDWSGRGYWLDWKYNIYTLIEREDGQPNHIDLIFKATGASQMSSAEIAHVTAKAESEGDEALQLLLMPELQPLARNRDIRLMLMDNGSDGMLLFALPEDKADAWHLIQIGESLIFNADAGVVADPRNGGRPARLSN